MNPRTVNRELQRARELLTKGNPWAAIHIHQSLAKHAPGQAAIWYEYGRAAASILQLDLAEQAWARACAISPNDPELFLQIGNHYVDARQRAKACSHYQRAAALKPDSTEALSRLAFIHEQYHQMDEARATVRQCLAANPRDESALYLQAVLARRDGDLPGAARQLADLIALGPVDPYIRSASRVELAQIHDRQGNPEQAMQSLAEAKALVLADPETRSFANVFDTITAADLRFLRDQPKDILSHWTRAAAKGPAGAAARLAFLGGHPRSGTTLLEQILAGHPEIAGLDEPVSFFRLSLPTINTASRLNAGQLNILRAAYVQGLEAEAGPGARGKLLLDKNPTLTAQFRVLLQLFPGLKTVIALRDPRDVILSCYFLNVRLSPASSKFLTLAGTVDHYRMLMDIWRCVREWEGLSSIETRYEDIVADAPREGRRVTEFLGLTWDESQAQFHTRAQTSAVNSPNYKEVSQPIYKSAVGKWRAYEKYLAPFLPALEPYCKAFGYE